MKTSTNQQDIQELSHDIRNIMCVLSGRIRILEKVLKHCPPLSKVGAAGIAHQMHCMHSAVYQGTALCDEHLQQPKYGMKIKSDLTDVVHECCDMISPLMGEKIELDIDLQHDCSSIPCGFVQLNRILLNLMKNGMESMSRSGGTLTISTGQRWLNNDAIRQTIYEGERCQGVYTYIQVEDQGCGLDAQAFSKNIDHIQSNKGIGHGYGLLSAISIVNAFKGLINITSQADKGTSIRLYFLTQVGFTDVMSGEGCHQVIDEQVSGLIEDISIRSKINKTTMAKTQ